MKTNRRREASAAERTNRRFRAIGVATVTVCTVLLLPMAIMSTQSATAFSIEQVWTTEMVTLSDGDAVTVKYVCCVKIYGAILGYPIGVPFELISTEPDAPVVSVEEMVLDAVTPTGCQASLIDDGIGGPIEVGPEEQAAWTVLALPETAPKPPLKMHFGIRCSAGGEVFALSAGICFHRFGSTSDSPVRLDAVDNVDLEPDMVDGGDVWTGFPYYYSVRASYPATTGVSWFRCLLIGTIQGAALEEGALTINPMDPTQVVESIEYGDESVTIAVRMNGGSYICPGYEELFDLELVFSLETESQLITYEFHVSTG